MALNTNVSSRNNPNEAVMNKIKRRLKTACDNVAFYADTTWTTESFCYQKANQELFATDTKLQDTMMEESAKARTVRDIIPHSKLAQYSNFEYNEAREMSYASPVSDISFYYPCLYKKDSIKEPWMLPEVEQVFIWLTYCKQFDLSSPKSLEELECVDEDNNSYTDHPCSYTEFHEFKPVLYDNFERTPGKTRYTVNNFLTRDDGHMTSPHTLNIDSFEDMLLKMRLKSDKIRSIWTRCNEVYSEDKSRKMNIFKSPLDNYYLSHLTKRSLLEQYQSEMRHVPFYFNDFKDKSCDFRNMQSLVLGLSDMKVNSMVPDVDNVHCTTGGVITDNAPIRRLYSDVVQGLSSNKTSPMKNRCSEFTSPSSTTTNVTKDTPIASPRTTTSTCASTEESLQNSQAKHPKSMPAQTVWNAPTTSWQNPPEVMNKIPKPKSPTQATVANNSTKFNTTYKDFYIAQMHVNNSNNNCSNLPTSSVNDCNPYDIYTCNAYVNSNYQSNTCSSVSNSFCNFYSTTNQYQQNQHTYTSAYPAINNANNSYAAYTNTNYSNQISSNSISVSPPNCRHNFAQSPLQLNSQTHHFFLNQYRNFYNVQHFTPQPYIILPQPMPKAPQRWTPAQHCLRPNTAQNYMPPQTTQYWNVPGQTLHRSNSNNQMFNPYHLQLFDTSKNNANGDARQRSKTKKFSLQSKIVSNKTLECAANKPDTSYLKATKPMLIPKSAFTSDILPISQSNAVFVKSNAKNDYKLIIRKEISTIVTPKAPSMMGAPKSYSCDVDSPTLMPVIESSSEDLERRALDEYQSSNESFYKDLEKQAVEQYEENSENLICPPNKYGFFGGLLFQNLLIYVLLTIYFSNNCNCSSLCVFRDLVTS